MIGVMARFFEGFWLPDQKLKSNGFVVPRLRYILNQDVCQADCGNCSESYVNKITTLDRYKKSRILHHLYIYDFMYFETEQTMRT